MTQRGVRRYGAPVRVVEQSEGQREGRVGLLRIALGAGAQVGDPGIQFHRGTERQDVAVECGQAQSIRQQQQCGWRVVPLQFSEFPVCPDQLRFELCRLSRTRQPRQSKPNTVDHRGQVPVIDVRPSGLGFHLRAHVIVTCAALS
jgi:hypothetical protein